MRRVTIVLVLLATLAGTGRPAHAAVSAPPRAMPAAAGAPTVDMFGRGVRMPAPRGMQLMPMPPNSRYKGVPYFRYSPDPSAPAKSNLSAIANAEPVMNRDDATARRSIAEKLAEKLPPPNPAMHAAWQRALGAARAGRRGALPPMGQGVVVVERIQGTPDAMIDLVEVDRDGRRTLLGSALVLARGRAVWLSVLLQSPQSTADIAQVRKALLDWVGDLRTANAKAS